MHTSEMNIEEIKASWLDKPLLANFKLNSEKLVFALIIILAIFTRFYKLEPRVMSHDETSHVYFSWLLYRGNGYAHDPVTHGPMQFHLVALSYFLFGDNDVTARIPAALFSIATVAFSWKYRRYLGRAGALVAAALFTISPYMLYYGRYVRNEAFVALFGVIMIWAMLRYMESGETRYLRYLTIVTVLHFCTKETSFIYVAQALLFLSLYLVYRITQRPWAQPEARTYFLSSLILSVILFTFGAMIRIMGGMLSVTGEPVYANVASIPSYVPYIVIGLGLLSLAAAIYFLFNGYTLSSLRQERSFDLAMLLGTLVLPMLSAFVVNFFGWELPVNATEVRQLTSTNILQIGGVLVVVLTISVVLGLWWNRRQWLVNAAIWYAIYTVLYTTMFTNGVGWFTGMIGSLGYWLAQQEVNRGSQPFYYYLLVQIPIYEYLPALGSLLAIGLAFRQWARVGKSSDKDTHHVESPIEEEGSVFDIPQPGFQKPPVLVLLGFWVVTSLLAYSMAGEKMPWLTVHMALPMILLAAWAFGHLIDTTDWSAFRNQRGWIVIGLLFVFVPAVLSALRMLLGANPPFSGKSLEQLADTSEFIIALVAAIASGYGLFRLMVDWTPRQVRRIFMLGFLSLLALLTLRTALTASFINYDRATEFLVYAHSGPGDKIALEQIEELSLRLTGGLDLAIAYDSDTTYPYWWYLRNYHSQVFFGDAPTRELRNNPAILVGETNFNKIDSIVGEAFYRFDYIRIWWPNQDYFNLTWDRILFALSDPLMREALFQIWLNRDFTRYGEATGRDFSLQYWRPANLMRLYIRKDIVAQLWDFGTTPAADVFFADPYEGKQITLDAYQVIGSPGTEPGLFQNPRDMAIAPDGSLYIADTGNHRIQHLAPDGTVLHVWGRFANLTAGEAPGGTFNEPWGIAVSPDGTVYVADTWNHRIQRFTSEGEFLNMWGFFGQAETPFSLWGPRDIAVDSQGNVYVTDTGNKRIVVYTAEGLNLTQFGGIGFEPGMFDEPVGISVDGDGLVYITDTWNQRIQVMIPDGTGNFLPLINWEIVAWYGQSTENKPYIAVDNEGNLYATDPEGYRVLHFTRTGTFINYFGNFGVSNNSFNLPTGIVVDNQGGVWVVDSSNHRLMHFTIPPAVPAEEPVGEPGD